MSTNNVLNVICFMWYGDRWARGQIDGADYVNRLARGVARHLTLPYRFICFTNDPEGIHTPKTGGTCHEIRSYVPLSTMGCLPRLQMFSPEARLQGQVLCFDLDSIIVGSLNDLGSYRGDFAVLSKGAPGQQWKAAGGIVGFNPESEIAREIWRTYSSNPRHVEKVTGGRERWWYREVTNNNCDRWQTMFPGQALSYKRKIRRRGGNLPKNVRVVYCHSKPRPHEIDVRREPWMKEYWV